MCTCPISLCFSLPLSLSYLVLHQHVHVPMTTGAWKDACTECAGLATTCEHCVPPADGSCEVCDSPWSPLDPLQQGWLAAPQSSLYGFMSVLPVKVYYRCCSNL